MTALTKVWTPEAVTGPLLEIVDGSVVPIEVCSAVASFWACAVAWDTCMLFCSLFDLVFVWLSGMSACWQSVAGVMRHGQPYHAGQALAAMEDPS